MLRFAKNMTNKGATKNLPGSDLAKQDVYTITLDAKINTEPEYVLGSWFWHLDGACSDIPMPRVTLLSCRRAPPIGTGETEFANTFFAYAALPEADKTLWRVCVSCIL
jgi:alpha-ketoglutarate-dependent taurine dioxygenase